MDPTPSFPLFSILPDELRLMIWNLDELEPRLVKVHFHMVTGRFFTTTQSPTRLLVCRESRLEALYRYRLLFGTAGFPPTIRVDVTIDTVQLEWDSLRFSSICDSGIWSIQFLEIGGLHTSFEKLASLLSLSGPAFLRSYVLPILFRFEYLQHLTIVSPRPSRPTTRNDMQLGILRPNRTLDWRDWRDWALHLEYQSNVTSTMLMFHLLDAMYKNLFPGNLRVYVVITREDGTRGSKQERLSTRLEN